MIMTNEEADAELQAVIDNNHDKLDKMRSMGWDLEAFEDKTGIALFKIKKDGTRNKSASISLTHIRRFGKSAWEIKVDGSTGAESNNFSTAVSAFNILVVVSEVHLNEGKDAAQYALHKLERRESRSFFYVDLTLSFDYSDSNDALSRRKVHVKEVMHEYGSYYLRGHCFLANDTRTFRDSRIENCMTDTGKSIANVVQFLRDNAIKNKPYTENKDWW